MFHAMRQQFPERSNLRTDTRSMGGPNVNMQSGDRSDNGTMLQLVRSAS